MFKLHDLPGDPGKKQQRKRVGRGEGSGQGGTSGKGHKGKDARSGAGKGAGFEGGQMPLIRRIPKFGFSNDNFRDKRAAVTLGQLENKFEAGAVVDLEALRKARLIALQTEYVKIIATGALTKKLIVHAHGYSAQARVAIEAAGGQCETV
jgi:large subunit ribosomal protein L15